MTRAIVALAALAIVAAEASAQVPAGGELRVNSYTTGLQNFADPAIDADGNFIVVWESVQGQTGVSGQRYSANGAPLGGEFQISAQGGRPKVASDPSGNLIVARWGNGPGDPDGVYVRRLRPDGTPVGGELLVNTFTPGQQLLASLTAAPAGNFVVVWDTNNLDGSGYGVFAQRFDPSGVKRGAEFRANTYTRGNQLNTPLVVDSVGNFTVVWSSYGQDGSFNGVYAQRFGGLQPTALAADPAPPTGNGVLEPGEIKEIRPTWRNDSGAPLIVSSQTGNPTGPPGGVPQVIGPVAAYGTLAAGASAQCTTCPVLEIPPTSPRPAAHWDAAVTETIVPDVQGQQKVWLLHVGKSFGDVPNTSPYYRFVETVFHNDVMGGCGGGQFCPTVCAATTWRCSC